MDKEDQPFQSDGLEEEDMDDDDDDDDEDFEKVEKLTLPLVSRWIFSDGLPIDGLEVPVMKEDDFIHDSMYRNDFVFGPRKDPPPHVFDPLPPPPADAMKAATKEKLYPSLSSIVNDTSKHTSTTIIPHQNLLLRMT
ncbi:hypothetical protein Tco_0484113 [Tanacetum coccineum]